MRATPLFALLFTLISVAPYLLLADSKECAPCHAQIAATYRNTGMGRSFSAAKPSGDVKDIYHKASDTHYSMYSRDGRYFQRRWQIGYDGREINVEEREASYVLGSGNHARTWLARNPDGKLIELPLGWYAENGGYFGLNPGYDTNHPPSQRPVPYECMFCHNAYPQLPTGAAPAVYGANIPEGIDCQRCHGPAERHIAAARTTPRNPSAIRSAIVNPARLSKARQMEICMQCHLETTSGRLPSLVRRFGRGPFSYVPGQPLGDYVISFDEAPGTGHDNKFEIASAAYRLRQSQCFLQSRNEMTCTTCHNPHDIPRGPAARQQYTSSCRQCHSPQDEFHLAATSCVECHMPKRRTDDAVHVVMTDHRIVRRLPEGNLLAEKPEPHPAREQEYRGEVVAYYPKLGARPDDALYIALAQVLHGANLALGIDQLRRLLATSPHPAPEFQAALKDALHPPVPQATQPVDEATCRKALQQDPYFAPANARLARLLAARGKRDEALYYFGKAASLAPNDSFNHYEYALTLVQMNRFDESQAEAEAAVRTGPDLSEAHELLGGLLSRKQDFDSALVHFQEAVRLKPDFARAQIDLGVNLARHGDLSGAEKHLKIAAQSTDPAIANIAQRALSQLRR